MKLTAQYSLSYMGRNYRTKNKIIMLQCSLKREIPIANFVLIKPKGFGIVFSFSIMNVDWQSAVSWNTFYGHYFKWNIYFLSKNTMLIYGKLL